MNHTLAIGPEDLNEFTICQRFYLGYLRSQYTFSLSYANFHIDNAVDFRFLFNEKEGLVFDMCKHRFRPYRECVGIDFDQIHQEWNHVCFAYKAVQLNFNTMESQMKSYHNGKFIQEGKIRMGFIDPFFPSIILYR